MSRGFLPAITALTVLAGSGIIYLLKSKNQAQKHIIERTIISRILISLRKKAFSTLRQISFIVNSLRTLQGQLEQKKIGEIFMRDGGSGQKKLKQIQQLIIQSQNITRKQFEQSCNYYIQRDIQIKILIQMLRKDMSMALQGVIQSYHGPLPRISAQKILIIEEQIIKRRMKIIQKHNLQQLSLRQCLLQEFQIQEYLSQQGLKHQKQPNQKLFISLLENHYRTDYQFRQKLQHLELKMDMFIIDLQTQVKNKKIKQQKL